MGPIFNSWQGKHPHCLCAGSPHSQIGRGVGQAVQLYLEVPGPRGSSSASVRTPAPGTSPCGPHSGGASGLPVCFSVCAHSLRKAGPSACSALYPQAWRRKLGEGVGRERVCLLGHAQRQQLRPQTSAPRNEPGCVPATPPSTSPRAGWSGPPGIDTPRLRPDAALPSPLGELLSAAPEGRGGEGSCPGLRLPLAPPCQHAGRVPSPQDASSPLSSLQRKRPGRGRPDASPRLQQEMEALFPCRISEKPPICSRAGGHGWGGHPWAGGMEAGTAWDG